MARLLLAQSRLYALRVGLHTTSRPDHAESLAANHDASTTRYDDEDECECSNNFSDDATRADDDHADGQRQCPGRWNKADQFPRSGTILYLRRLLGWRILGLSRLQPLSYAGLATCWRDDVQSPSSSVDIAKELRRKLCNNHPTIQIMEAEGMAREAYSRETTVILAGWYVAREKRVSTLGYSSTGGVVTCDMATDCCRTVEGHSVVSIMPAPLLSTSIRTLCLRKPCGGVW